MHKDFYSPFDYFLFCYLLIYVNLINECANIVIIARLEGTKIFSIPYNIKIFFVDKRKHKLFISLCFRDCFHSKCFALFFWCVFWYLFGIKSMWANIAIMSLNILCYNSFLRRGSEVEAKCTLRMLQLKDKNYFKRARN